MKISVVIPTYNSSAVIQATLESVFMQTTPADEILVMDDGSTDNTVAILKSYEPRITVLQQANQGVAQARNALSARANGDLVAFLDHDDLWRPGYLAAQRKSFETFPRAVAFFTGHVDFHGFGAHTWEAGSVVGVPELIAPLDFLKRYNETTGLFGSMSFCCVPKRVLTAMGNEPFRVSGVDDSYLCTVLPLFGSVVYDPTSLVAYRITRQSQSANRLKSLRAWVGVFEILNERYAKIADSRMRHEFDIAAAAKRRWYAKLLMGAGEITEGRRQFKAAIANSDCVKSKAKTLAWLALTYAPSALQPSWPSSDRAFETPSGVEREKEAAPVQGVPLAAPRDGVRPDTAP